VFFVNPHLCRIFAFVKKLVFEYLNTTYPNAYIRQTKFGILLCGYNKENSGWLYVRKNMLETVMNLFGCNFLTADDYIIEWCETRPVFESVKNSTSDEVLVLQMSPEVFTYRLK
jgi:hypothetical protein